MHDVPDTLLARTQDALAELQIKLLPANNSALHAQVVGTLVDAEATADAVLFRLGNGDSVLRPGRLLAAGPPDADGWRSMDWAFADEGGAARERWWLLARGRRHLLVRLVARGGTEDEAAAAFGAEDATRWFAAVRSALVVE
jgi:hypothetical protein